MEVILRNLPYTVTVLILRAHVVRYIKRFCTRRVHFGVLSEDQFVYLLFYAYLYVPSTCTFLLPSGAFRMTGD